MRAQGFSCSLDVLNKGLGISELQFLIKKALQNFQLYFFLLHFLVIKTLDLDPDSLEMLDLYLDPDSCESGSTTLIYSLALKCISKVCVCTLYIWRSHDL